MIKQQEPQEEQVNEFSVMNTKTKYDNKETDIKLSEDDIPF